MLYNKINKSLLALSPQWSAFQKKCGDTNSLLIENMKDDYFGWLAGMLWENNRERVLVLAEDSVVARKIGYNLQLWGVEHVVLPSSWNQIDRERLQKISIYLHNFRLRGGLVVASVEEWSGGWGYCYQPDAKLKVGDKLRFADWSGRLVQLGYVRTRKVSAEGEYAVMGDVWIIWPLGEKQPWRIETSDNQVQGLSQVDLLTGEVQKTAPNILIGGWLQRVDEGTAMGDIWKEKMSMDRLVMYGVDEDKGDWKEIKTRRVYFYTRPKNKPTELNWPMRDFAWGLGGMEAFAKYLAKNEMRHNIVVTANVKEFRRWINELQLPNQDFEIFEGSIPAGGWLTDDKTAIWSDRELFGVVRKKVSVKRQAVNFKKLAEFKVGDLVVHSDHGIGLLSDFTTRHVEEVVKDYLVITYDRGDLLYVPIEQLNKVSKYIGSKLVKLSRLGSVVWEKKKRRVKKQVEEMAKELLRLYARRKLVKRKPYTFSTAKMIQLEDTFDYQLTDDQERALKEIHADLDRDYPMDRLLCGDVGFGKTELAIRIAGRVAADGRQVAVLVPTTILAEQHYVTFLERLGQLGIRVEVLSRLRDKDYQKNVLAKIAQGKVDVVVGTHRILQKDVKFKKLGMLVIDEEQKFGVRAKERLKKLRNNVDILSMSATPIPRTLNMAMGGVRDLSLLEVAPEGRRAVQTEVMPYADAVIVDAVEKEVSRGGQVFVIHNRVRTIAGLKDHLQVILPKGVKIGVAHGQMSEKDLAQVMNAFAGGEYDVLVATTIVENGLDLPNVNTLIVENAAGLGLSQLYQLRGRVGRSKTKAYAYFLYRSEKLKLKAKQRLQAITEARELGAGMKLAMADMEIRGAGNILGVQQHGNVHAVGLGMFLDMLNEMVGVLKQDTTSEQLSEDKIVIDLPVSFSVPKHYIEDGEGRLYWEQRIAAQIKIEDIDRLEKEMTEQYGVMPDECRNLFKVVKIRLLAQINGITHIILKKQRLLSGQEEKNLVIRWNQDISMELVKYLSSLSDQWVYRNEEAVIDVNKLDKHGWFNWLYELMQKLPELED